jgi:dTDP-glucose pyrophosphorylase
MATESTIILCGGPINYSNLPIGTNQSNAMIPVNGRPVIGWILDDLLAKGIRRAVVVLREQDHRLQEFLDRVYAARMDVLTAPLGQDGTIVQSLEAGMNRLQADGLVRVILGDTLIRDRYESDEDFAYVGDVEESRRWCLVVTASDGRINDYLDKRETSLSPKLALAGYYHFLDGAALRMSIEQSIAADETELSDVLRRYAFTHPIRARRVTDWYDFGHIDNMVAARRRLLQPRSFNSLTINPVLNTITKISDHDEKLRDELNWYLGIPDELKILTPRLIRHQATNGRIEVVQEYYGYPTLAELYVYADLHPENWFSIVRHVLRIHKEFCRYGGPPAAADAENVYARKTWDRLETLVEQDSAWNSLLSRETVIVNDRQLSGIYALRDVLEQKARELALNATTRVIHGDFCFSNILFDVNSQIIRIIDPRGSFGRKGIYGDPRYDIAKLRHSICGMYDYILADMFELRERGGEFRCQTYANGKPRVVGQMFDAMVSEMGYDLEEIRLIEGLLFVSMLPLHQGQPARQRMMYLTGLSLLNDACSTRPIASQHYAHSN